MATWKEDIIKALENLGGVAHLSKIYKEVERIREGNLNPTWDRTVQRELETNSSDSDAFKKDRKGDDLFYMAEGKGKGVWGLRNFDDGKLFFGELENIKVGQIFKDRDELSKTRVHGPTMSGIWGRESEGACSIVLSGGCAGMSYVMEYSKEINPNDEVIEDKGVKVFIDSAAVMYLLGTEMDYKKEEFSSSFVFNNPNETERCGCGESFKID